MNTQVLLQKLVEIEHALHRGDYLAVHQLVLEAQDRVLHIEREMIDLQADKVRRSAPVPTFSRYIPRKR